MADPRAGAERPAARASGTGVWLIVAATLVVDQLTKVAFRTWLPPAETRPLLPGILHVTHVQNTGMAFGLFRGHPNVFAWLAVLVAAWIIVELRHPPQDRWMRIGLALILSGAVGNLIDRVRAGVVTDFIDLRVWPVFNVADSAITIGVALLIVRSLFHPSKAKP